MTITSADITGETVDKTVPTVGPISNPGPTRGPELVEIFPTGMTGAGTTIAGADTATAGKDAITLWDAG